MQGNYNAVLSPLLIKTIHSLCNGRLQCSMLIPHVEWCDTALTETHKAHPYIYIYIDVGFYCVSSMPSLSVFDENKSWLHFYFSVCSLEEI